MPADEAIVLAGGLGTRLRFVVSDLPKPLAPVAGRPFLAWVLDHLAQSGIGRVVLAVGYMAESIRDVVGTQWDGMAIDYSIEVRPLGTGGAVRQACAMLHGSQVHVLNGDTFLRYQPGALERSVKAVGASLGMALANVPDVSRFGAVECVDTRVTGFREKGSAGPGYINAGCYFLTEAAIGESHVTENITSVAQAARLTSGGAKTTQDAAGELAGMAAELQKIVGVFKYAQGGVLGALPVS